jgi:hypothetical protein
VHVPLRGGVVALMSDGALRARLQRALVDRNQARIRDVLVAYDVLACKSCSRGEQAMRIYPESGWGVTCICEPDQGCGAAHSILID